MESSNAGEPTLGASIAELINTLKTWGIRVSPSSRLGTMFRVIKSVGPEVGSLAYKIGAQAFIDVSQILHITRDLGQPVTGSEHERLLQEIIKDPTLPQDTGAHSPGRDAQFHLRVAAYATKAGFNPQFEEPDLVCSLDGTQIGLAAKRLKSPENLENLIRGARRQIVESGIPGVIAMETSLAGNEANSPISPRMSRAEFCRRRQAFFEGFARTHRPLINKWIGTTWVRGVILFDTQLHLDYGHEHVPRSYIAALPLCDQNEARRREFVQLFELLRESGHQPGPR